MAEINYSVYDRTLREIDSLIESKSQNDHTSRNYLGMSQIGDECERKLFYSFRQCKKRQIKASGLRAIQDGYAQEDVMADRLRLNPEITLITEKDGEQIEFDHVDGHFRGHCDGVIKGIVENSTVWHIWEHKSVNETKFNLLKKLRIEHGEKKALEKWDEVYFAQAQIYMHSAGLKKHYLTVSTPGGRDYISVRTELNENVVESILKKAHRIIYGTSLPAKISDKPEYFKCKFCDYHSICHHNEPVERSCGTCFNFEVKPGKFYCNAMRSDVTNQKPCETWKLNPIFQTASDLVPEPEKQQSKFEWIKQK